MDLGLRGKKAFVSGSTAGIGLAIATGLANEGASVVINGRTEARVASALETIHQSVSNAAVEGIAADLGTGEGVAAVQKKLPQIDILINNLGIFEPKPFLEITDTDWLHTFEVNVLSGVRLSRAFLPGMLKKNWGRIVFLSSESAVQIPAEMIHYGTTKTAQLAVARGIAESVAGTGVTVNSVLPGPTHSEGVGIFVERLSKANKQSVEEFEKNFIATMRPSSLIKRFATTEEVANLVVYLASERSAATTGSALRVDGGVVRSIV